MSYWRWMKVLVGAAVLGLATSGAVAADGADNDELKDFEAQLEEARQQLDKAARQLAELHEKTFDKSRSAFATSVYGPDRAMLGVLIGDKGADGVTLSGVTPGSGAADAGLEAGDKLLVIGDVRLDEGNGHEALSKFMGDVVPGESVALQYERDGQAFDAAVVTQSHADHYSYMLDDKLAAFGKDFSFDFNLGDVGVMRSRVLSGKGPRLVDIDADLGAYFGVDGGILVLEAPDACELKSGDVLLTLDGEVPESARDARRKIARADADIAATVMREQQETSVAIEPGSFLIGTVAVPGQHVKVLRIDDGEVEVIIDD